MDEESHRKQLEREQESNNCGYKKFLKEEREQAFTRCKPCSFY